MLRLQDSLYSAASAFPSPMVSCSSPLYLSHSLWFSHLVDLLAVCAHTKHVPTLEIYHSSFPLFWSVLLSFICMAHSLPSVWSLIKYCLFHEAGSVHPISNGTPSLNSLSPGSALFYFNSTFHHPSFYRVTYLFIACLPHEKISFINIGIFVGLVHCHIPRTWDSAWRIEDAH